MGFAGSWLDSEFVMQSLPLTDYMYHIFSTIVISE